MWPNAALLLFLCSFVVSENTKPNIIVIIADDMGFNDVGFHGSNEIPTPNIDALAYNGVILNSHYTQALCTPSRSAFLTGKYPIHLGMQHLVIIEPEPWGLSLNETILPQYLKRNGYVTHAVGKWHLGFHKKEYTPTYRGFDSHFGYWQGLQDYYNHFVHSTFTEEYGYDMRRNMSVDWSAKDKYSTTLFTEEAVKLIHEHDTSNPMFLYLAHLAPHTGNAADPLQAPDEEIAKFAHIADPERRVYAAMVSLLDKSVGTVIAALREKRMLENSIVLFMADNGAQTIGIHANHGSNYPLRGMKNSVWEGGVRGAAAIWSPLIKKPQRVSHHLMHISDWLPTLYSAAGLDKNQLPKMDGMDMWPAISDGEESPRTGMVINIDDVLGYGGVRQGDWKYVYGSTMKGIHEKWYGSPGNNSSTYDEDAIIQSHVATSLAAVTTFRQIKEKKEKLMDETDHDFDVKLLDKETIRKIREDATVRCSIPDDSGLPEEAKCDPLKNPCLFNVINDPCETTNLASERPDILEAIEREVENYRKTALPPRNKKRDPKADPKRYNNTWVPWLDEDIVAEYQPHFNVLSPLTIGFIATACSVVLIMILILVGLAIKKRSKLSKSLSSLRETHSGYIPAERKPSNQFFEDRELQMHCSLKDDIRTLE